ncbi:MAG: hypothetical protein ACL93V_14335 [Candidatus Electrothrix sp. YB6]
MLVVFNTVGFLWLLVAFGIAIGLQSAGIIIDKKGDYFLEVIATSIILFDFAFRFLIGKNRKLEEEDESKNVTEDVSGHWLIGSKFGGSLMFLPTYIAAILGYLFLVFVVKV